MRALLRSTVCGGAWCVRRSPLVEGGEKAGARASRRARARCGAHVRFQVRAAALVPRFLTTSPARQLCWPVSQVPGRVVFALGRHDVPGDLGPRAGVLRSACRIPERVDVGSSRGAFSDTVRSVRDARIVLVLRRAEQSGNAALPTLAALGGVEGGALASDGARVRGGVPAGVTKLSPTRAYVRFPGPSAFGRVVRSSFRVAG